MPIIPDPSIPPSAAAPGFIASLKNYLQIIQQEVNLLANGYVAGKLNATTAAPVPGNKATYAKGDFIPNNNPVVTGAAGAQFIITGWMCTLGGQPGTWVQCRTLTGT